MTLAAQTKYILLAFIKSKDLLFENDEKTRDMFAALR